MACFFATIGVAPMSTISWLHLSDLHARDEGNAVERAVFDGMLKDIEA
jgi:hypothetical protein